MRITWFSQSAEVQATFLGDLRKLKERHIDRDVEQISISGDITVTPGFTMLLVQGLTEANGSGIVALELTPANDKDKVLLVSLVELLSPPTNIDVEEDEDQGYDSPQNHLSYNWMDYNCGIAKYGRFPKLDKGYIVTIPAGSGNIPDFLGRIDGLYQNQSRPLLFLLLLNR
ncbi:hypothetical protein V490_08037 [Pseudogymnoascus sp. VKM F-3557]|nr:hypothetical protein V490_08037 [Pseudogymnoascus sp. VKM F-3557]